MTPNAFHTRRDAFPTLREPFGNPFRALPIFIGPWKDEKGPWKAEKGPKGPVSARSRPILAVSSAFGVYFACFPAFGFR